MILKEGKIRKDAIVHVMKFLSLQYELPRGSADRGSPLLGKQADYNLA